MRTVKPSGDFLVKVVADGHEAMAKVSDFAKGAGLAQLATDAGGGVAGVYGQGGQIIKFSKTAAGGPDVSITGATTEQVLATLSLPADFLGANGFIRGTLRFQYTNNANNKVMRVRLGGIAGASLAGMIGTTNGYMTYQFLINNKGAKNSQIGNATDGIWQASSTSVPSTGSADTTQALDVVVTGQLTNAADTLTLRSWHIEAVPME